MNKVVRPTVHAALAMEIPGRLALMNVVNSEVFFEGSTVAGSTSNAAFPSLLNCGNSVLLLVHRVGTQKNTADGVQYLWRSVSGGESWKRVELGLRQPDDAGLREYRTGALSEIGNGRVAMMLTWIDHVDFDTPICNPETGGLMPIQIGWIESFDRGETWSELREIPVAPMVQPCGNGTMLRLESGRLIVGFETYKAWDDESAWSARSTVVFSDDDGNTWSPPVTVAGDPAHHMFYWDHHMLLRTDGSLLDVIWTDDARNPGVSQIYTAESHDGGTTWSEPLSTGIEGQYSELMELADGRFLLMHVQRTGDPSIRLRLGEYNGRQWKFNDEFVLYSQTHNDLHGVEKQEFTEYLETMATWSFGWPSMVRLGDGTMLVAYYVGLGHQSSIRLSRLTLNLEGQAG